MKHSLCRISHLWVEHIQGVLGMKPGRLLTIVAAALIASAAVAGTPQTASASSCTVPILGTINVANWRTRASGNWNSNAVWQCQGPITSTWYDAAAGQYPSNNENTDNVTIRSGHTVTMVASEQIGSLTIDLRPFFTIWPLIVHNLG